MGNKLALTVGGVHKVGRKAYLTVGGVHRKVKKAYLTVGGVHKKCFSGGELAYYGKLTPLSQARALGAATTVGNYALFGGGYYDASTYTAVVDAYDMSLSRTTPTGLNYDGESLVAATVGGYALFSCLERDFYSSPVIAYDTSLTRTFPSKLNKCREELAATTVGGYALFGGGCMMPSGTYSMTYLAVVDAYNISLTRTTPTELSEGRAYIAATTVGDYALFGGGYGGPKYSVVDAYDTSLTRTTPTALSEKKHYMAATTLGDYALFGGGSIGSTTSTAVVEAYTII